MFRARFVGLDGDRDRRRFRQSRESGRGFLQEQKHQRLIGFSAGGVYDITARLLSRFMGRHIPGNPNLVPRNMVGAAGFRLANWLYQSRPERRDHVRHVRARHRLQPLARSARGTDRGDKIQLARQYQRRGFNLRGAARERHHQIRAGVQPGTRRRLDRQAAAMTSSSPRSSTAFSEPNSARSRVFPAAPRSSWRCNAAKSAGVAGGRGRA